MLGLWVPHYARVVCGGIEMYHKGKVISVEVGSYLSTSTPVFVIDSGLSVGKSFESLIHHAGRQPRSLASAKDYFAQPCVRAPSRSTIAARATSISSLWLTSSICNCSITGPSARAGT